MRRKGRLVVTFDDSDFFLSLVYLLVRLFRHWILCCNYPSYNRLVKGSTSHPQEVKSLKAGNFPFFVKCSNFLVKEHNTTLKVARTTKKL